MTNNILIFSLCIIPSLILMWYIFIKDKIEKEPTILLVSLFVGGIISSIISYLLSNILKNYIAFLNYDYSSMNIFELLFKLIVTIAFIEEISKWIINYSVTWKRKEFNHIYDPIVYSSFVSLGFATYENILYGFAFSSHGFLPLLLRGITSVPSHCCFGIIMGYFLGRAKQNKFIKNKLFSICIPVLLHFVYNLFLLIAEKSNYILFILYIIFLFSTSLFIVIKTCSIKKQI